MPSTDFLTPRRRDAGLVLLGVVLLAGPVWIPMLHLDDPTYRYESTRVTVDGSGVAFANESVVPAGTTLSEEIACTGESSRECIFERYLARNNTVPTGIYTTSANGTFDPFDAGPDRYEYVQINGTVYSATSLVNSSRRYVVANGTVYEKGEAPEGADTSGDLNRTELFHRPASPGEVLQDVSRPVEDVPDPVASAATSGDGIAHRDVDVPETPIRTGEDTYSRVYIVSQRRAGGLASLDPVLFFGTPLAGLAVLNRLRRRVEVTYLGAIESGENRTDEN